LNHLDILVNNAVAMFEKPALDISWEDWNLILDTNLRGSFFVSQAVARRMIPRRYGRIVNIGSVTSVSGYARPRTIRGQPGGIRQLTMSLADDWGKHGVTVNCLAPGWFRTEQNKVLYENKEWVDYLCDRIPVKRPGQPQDLDAAVVFLAAESSRYVTGQTLLVDGGISTGAVPALAPVGPTNRRRRKRCPGSENMSRTSFRRGILAASLSLFFLTVAFCDAAGRCPKGFAVYFVDVEGGQATLFVTPVGQSLLIDTGWPGFDGRDADRIVAAVKLAGISKIDYVLITHFHNDHVGGVPQLVARIP